MISLRRQYLKAEKGGVFCTYIPSFILVPHEKGRTLCQKQNNHIHFHGDCLVFEFTRSKGHKKGENNLGPWHVYANPLKMRLCPVLSLLRYLF